MAEHISEKDDFGIAECPSYLKRLDLGCGLNKRKGFIGVDLSPDTNADVIHDLNSYPYPFEDNSIFEIFTSHFIEHVNDIKAFMEECWRILVPRGRMEILAPYYTSMGSIQDHTHVRSICDNTFNYFCKQGLKGMGITQYSIKCDFEIMNKRLYFTNEWENRADEARMWAARHYWNVVSDIEFTLQAIK